MDVGEPILLEALHHPIAGGLVSRGVGEPWTVDVGEVKLVIHHLRVFERLRFDAVNHARSTGFFRVEVDR